MKRNAVKILGPAISVASLLLGTACLSYADTEDRMEKSFSVKPGGKLTTDLDRGSIEIKTSDDHAVKVTVIRKVDGRRSRAEEILKEHEIQFGQDGNEVSIHSRFEGDQSWFRRLRGYNFSVHYIISTPKSFNLDLKSAGGGISITDLQGDVKARTSGGSLKFGQIDGPVWGRTSGGSITVAGCADSADVETSGGSISIGEVDGPINAKTSGGSIKIERSAGDVQARTSGGGITVAEVIGKIEASTSGGSINARISTQPEGPCLLKTSGGSISVKLASSVAVDLDAKTSGGRVVTDFPVTVQGERKGSELKTAINGGGPALVFKTSGGNVTISKM